tara:strand:+ start:65 stop:2008 length:1944 start_codon:yes stop_codon:yes gene_type:complete
MDGKVFPLDNPFAKEGSTVTGDRGGKLSMDYGNVNGPPIHPSCRCTLVPMVDTALLDDIVPSGSVPIDPTADYKEPMKIFETRLKKAKGISAAERRILIEQYKQADNELQQIVARGPIPKGVKRDLPDSKNSYYHPQEKVTHMSRVTADRTSTHEYGHFLDNMFSKKPNNFFGTSRSAWFSKTGDFGKEIRKLSKEIVKETKKDLKKWKIYSQNRLKQLNKMSDTKLRDTLVKMSGQNAFYDPDAIRVIGEYIKVFGDKFDDTTRKGIKKFIVNTEYEGRVAIRDLQRNLGINDRSAKDIISALSKGGQSSGHSIEYWATTPYQEPEIFTQLMSLTINNRAEYNILKKRFPKLVKGFEDKIKEARVMVNKPIRGGQTGVTAPKPTPSTVLPTSDISQLTSNVSVAENWGKKNADEIFNLGNAGNIEFPETVTGRAKLLTEAAEDVAVMAEKKMLYKEFSEEAIKSFKSWSSASGQGLETIGQSPIMSTAMSYAKTGKFTYSSDMGVVGMMSNGSADQLLTMINASRKVTDEVLELSHIAASVQREWLKKQGVKEFKVFRGMNSMKADDIATMKKTKQIKEMNGTYWSTDVNHAGRYAVGDSHILVEATIPIDDVMWFYGGLSTLGPESGLVSTGTKFRKIKVLRASK